VIVALKYANVLFVVIRMCGVDEFAETRDLSASAVFRIGCGALTLSCLALHDVIVNVGNDPPKQKLSLNAILNGEHV
jgi:hypothetical protein